MATSDYKRVLLKLSGEALMGEGGGIIDAATLHTIVAQVRQLVDAGIDVRLIAMATIKPIDKEMLYQAAAETGTIVTAEEHSIIGGLGGAVAEAISSSFPAHIEMIGLRDTFARTGFDPESLMDDCGLAVNDIVKAVKRALNRKR